jgi:hypothetical protein
MMPDQWENLASYAARIGRNAGHVRKLCPALARQGRARLVRGDGRRPYWLIRCDDTQEPSRPQSGTARPSNDSTTVIAPPGSIVIVMPLGDSARTDVLKALRGQFKASK